MSPLLARHTRAFLKYAQGFLCGDMATDAPFRLKMDHSMRVLDEARMIVQGESMPGDQAETIMLCALYHDIGRFTQLKRFGTFRDDKSFDHGLEGARTLAKGRFLAGLDNRVSKTVIGAVRLHNAKKLPGKLPEELDRAVRVVRDADKLDILRVLLSNFILGENAPPSVLLDLENHPRKYTPSVLRTLVQGAPPDRADLVYVNDFKLFILGWVFALETASARSAFTSRRYPQKILDLLPPNGEFDALRLSWSPA